MNAKPIECPVIKLTREDMRRGFECTIEKLEDTISKYGIAKLIPPTGWTPRSAGYKDDLDIIIPRPIRQNVTGGRGIFRGIMVEEKPMSLNNQFRPFAMAPENNPKKTDQNDIEGLEYQFWRNMRFQPPLYGADVEGSLFDDDIQGWNLGKLDTILSRTLDEKNISIPGVVTPYLYFGMWRSIFAWHTEDMDLYSVNYLHYGAAKSWYSIQPEHRQKFENMLRSLSETQELFRGCPEFLRHKELLISPEILKAHCVPYVRAVQHPGEFIINFPGAYHSGFNHGFNCAESTNFATLRWIPVGAKAGFCECRGDTVKIDMRLFGVELSDDDEEIEDEAGDQLEGPEKPKLSRSLPKARQARPKKIQKQAAARDGCTKRGRGAPRKCPVPEPNQLNRPRGRPRMEPAMSSPLVAIPKRPRGRPRKDALPAGSIKLVAAATESGIGIPNLPGSHSMHQLVHTSDQGLGASPQQQGVVAVALQQLPKRKRGRPSKADTSDRAAALAVVLSGSSSDPQQLESAQEIAGGAVTQICALRGTDCQQPGPPPKVLGHRASGNP